MSLILFSTMGVIIFSLSSSLSFPLPLSPRTSQYLLGFPETHSIDQAGLQLGDLPASAPQVQRLQAWVSTALSFLIF